MNAQNSSRLIKYGSKTYSLENITPTSKIEIKGTGSMFILVKTIGDFFRFGTLTRQESAALSKSAKDFIIRTTPKSILYGIPSVGENSVIRVKVVDEEKDMFASHEYALFAQEYELAEGDKPKVFSELGEIDVTGTAPEILVSSLGVSDFIAHYHNLKNKSFRFSLLKFPLYRQPYVSIFPGTRSQAIDLFFERIQARFQSGRDLSVVPAAGVVTPNLDHLRMLVEDQDKELQEVYATAFLQTADGYPPLVKYAKESIGYATAEQVSGVEVFMSIMNKIGSESLPYTIYLVGGFENTNKKVKDHFVQSYPHMAQNFVGMSAPPVGFMNDKAVVEKIFKDIDKKKPDFVFVCLSAPNQEKFSYRMVNAGVNFGLGFGIGRAFDLISGYQKKEPKIIEDLHLIWLYRAFANKTYAKRVPKDLLFALRSLLS